MPSPSALAFLPRGPFQPCSWEFHVCSAGRSSIYLQTQTFVEEGRHAICTLVGNAFSPAWLPFGNIGLSARWVSLEQGHVPAWDTGGTLGDFPLVMC